MRATRTPVLATLTGSSGRLRQTWVVVLAVLAALIGGASAASAHSALVYSDPADGATIDAPPQTITMQFNEQLGGSAASVGVLIENADPVKLDGAVSGDTVTVDLSTGQLAEVLATHSAGKWAIAFQVVSADGHPISGTLTFTVQGEPGAPSAGAADSPVSGSIGPVSEEDQTNNNGLSAGVWAGLAVLVALMVGGGLFAANRRAR